MHALPLLLKAPLLAMVLVAGIYDIRYRRIPNWAVLAGLLLGFAGNAILSRWAGLGTAGLGLGLALLIYFPLYMLHGMGAGDVKLMAAVGAIAGPANWMGVLVLTGILGGVFALVLMVSQGALRATFRNIGLILWELAHLRVPYRRHQAIDVRNAAALRLPHGAVIALAVIAFTSLPAWMG
jgi:prepilin peptidase CpaA